MREHTRLRLISESRRIYNRLVLFTAVLIAGIVLLARPETLDSPLWFGVGVTGALVSLVAIALNILLVRGLDYDDEPPPAGDVSDTLLFSEQRQPGVKLWTSDDNLIKIGLHEMSQRNWHVLHEKLHAANWYWNRQNVAEAGVFKSITAPGIFNRLTEDWRRLGMLDGRRVNGRGRSALREAGGIRMVT